MSSFSDRFTEKLAEIGGVRPLLDRFHPLRKAEVDAIERRFEIYLPDEYRAFLTEFGGVGFNNQIGIQMIDESPGGGVENRETIDHLFGAKSEQHFALSRNIEYWNGLPSDIIPIGDDLFGNLLCLGVEGNRCDKFFFRDHDHGTFHLAAKSFDDLVQRLIVVCINKSK